MQVFVGGQGGEVALFAVGALPVGEPAVIRHHDGDEMRALVAIDHGLAQFRFGDDHAFDPLRCHVIAAGIDDDVFLAIGNHKMSVFIQLTDVAGVQPTRAPAM